MLGQRVGEQPGDLGGPHVLVLEVDQPPRPLDRLRVARGPPTARRPARSRTAAGSPDRSAGSARRAARTPAAAAAAGGSGSACIRVWCSLSWIQAIGWSSSGLFGSSQRSRNTVSSTPTAGPRICSCTSCHGGFGPYAAAIGSALRVAAVVGVVAAASSRGRSRRRRRRPWTGPRRAAGRRTSGGGCPSGGSAGRGSPRRRRARSPGPARGWPPCSATAAAMCERQTSPRTHTPALDRLGEQLGHRRAVLAQPLVGIAPPVGEEQVVARRPATAPRRPAGRSTRCRAPAARRGCPRSRPAARCAGCPARRR